MAVGLRIAMTGKVFGHSHHTLALHSFHVLYAQVGHPLRHLTERTYPNHRVVRIAVHIHHRGKVHMYTHIMALPSYLLPHIIQQRVHFFGKQAEIRIIGKRVAVLQPHSQPPLGIDTHQQRHLAQTLIALDLWQGFLGRTHKKAHSAHLGLAKHLLEIPLCLAVHVQRHPYHHQLRYLLFQIQILHHRVHPRGGQCWFRMLYCNHLAVHFLCRFLHPTHLAIAHSHSRQHNQNSYYQYTFLHIPLSIDVLQLSFHYYCFPVSL